MALHVTIIERVFIKFKQLLSGEDIRPFLENIRDSEERNAYILMDRSVSSAIINQTKHFFGLYKDGLFGPMLMFSEQR